MNSTTPLHSGTTVSDGQALRQAAKDVLLGSWIGAGGGTASVKVFARLQGGPWKQIVQFDLSGANDRAEYLLTEPWFELYGSISAINAATATVAMGSA